MRAYAEKVCASRIRRKYLVDNDLRSILRAGHYAHYARKPKA